MHPEFRFDSMCAANLKILYERLNHVNSNFMVFYWVNRNVYYLGKHYIDGANGVKGEGERERRRDGEMQAVHLCVINIIYTERFFAYVQTK